ncbi:MAG: hypothetical protein LBQ50_11250 [Planctomycetaceae bacterium]|nr:hypothetical protein [Planctomycetaceae bacterium]
MLSDISERFPVLNRAAANLISDSPNRYPFPVFHKLDFVILHGTRESCKFSIAQNTFRP